MRYLGETFDIHGGGLDLVFPHHENEIAQSESFTGKPFARYWMHNGLLQRTGDARKLGGRRVGDLKDQEAEKMSKSKGNIVTVTELLSRHQPETVRFFLLATHYRRPIDFSDDRIEEVSRGMHGFYRFFERYERITAHSYFNVPPLGTNDPAPADGPRHEVLSEIKAQRVRFLEAMDDDFNTGGAIGVLYDLLRLLNGLADRMELDAKGKSDQVLQAALHYGVAVLRELTGILGVFPSPNGTRARDDLSAKLVELLIDLRKQARAQKNFNLADDIRKRLGELGVTLEDRPDGTTWRLE
jgi:cysteinyl-tRNA synthetase